MEFHGVQLHRLVESDSDQELGAIVRQSVMYREIVQEDTENEKYVFNTYDQTIKTL